MQWFAITNRNKRGRSSFGDEPETFGKLHWLSKKGGMPSRNNRLSFDYIGDSEDEAATAAFVKSLRSELLARARKLNDRGIDKKPILLIYIHGYFNNWGQSREEYVEFRRNCQTHLGPDFERYCLPILFTWPSGGQVLEYMEDRDDARISALAVKNMVYQLFKATRNLEDCVSNVSVCAHSMGNYVLREAFMSLAGSPQSPAGTFIDQFVMFAADVGNTSLDPGGKGFGIPRFSNRVSVYYSPADAVLRKSKRKNGRARLGRTLSSGFRDTPDSVVFIDMRHWANDEKLQQLFPNGAPGVHSCFRSVPAVLEDMFEVLKGVDREVIPNRERLVLNKHYEIME